MTEATSAAATSPSPFAGGDWFDPLEEAVRRRVRAFIEELLEEELEVALGRGRCERDGAAKGHGRRPRRLVTSFGPLELTVPRARLRDAAGEREWRSELLPAYRRLSRRAEALVTPPGSTPAGCGGRWPACSPAGSARTRSAGPGGGPARPGRPGAGATSPAGASAG